MVKNVVDSRGNHKGYLICDFFIPKSYEKYLIQTVPSCEKVTLVYINRNSFSLGCKTYNIRGFPFMFEELSMFLLNCKSNNIKLNDIVFIPISFSDIDYSNLSEFWKIARDMQCSQIKVLGIYDTVSEVLLGYMMSCNNLFSSTDYRISMIEMRRKDKGVGTRVVKQLQSLGKNISGLSLVSAKGFWQKVGASVDADLNFML